MNKVSDSLSETSFEFSLSRSGAVTVSWQGRLLCSSRDPLAEAQGWTRHQGFSVVDQVIVLGLGVGHHVQLLAEQRPQQQILVLDYHSQLIKKFNNENSLSNVKTQDLHFCTGNELMSLIQQALPVFAFRPAWSGLEQQYELLKKELSGQSTHALKLQAQAGSCYQLAQALRDGQKNILNDYISIKDIEVLMQGDKNSFEAKAWQVLRELVK